MTVDEALEFAERARAPELSFNEYEFQAMHALADEVLRLREAIELREKVARCLRDERDLFRAASEAAELKIVELKADLKRWTDQHMLALGNGNTKMHVVYGAFEAIARVRQDHQQLHELKEKLELVAAERNKRMAKLARVEALPARWRELQPPFEPRTQDSYAVRSAFERSAFEQLTTELEAALRDDPQQAAGGDDK